MTGKFTENVHSLGFTSGNALRSVLQHVSQWITTTGGASDDATSVLRSLPSLGESIFYLTSLPERYTTWWLNLLRDDPVHVLVETMLILFCVYMIFVQRRTDWRTMQKARKDAPTEKEVEELLAEWKKNLRKPLTYSGEGNDPVSAATSSLGNGMVVERVEGSRLIIRREDDDDDGKEGTKAEHGTDNKMVRFHNDVGKSDPPSPSSLSSTSSLPTPPRGVRSVFNFATHDYLAAASSPLLRRTAKRALATYGCGSCGPRGFYGTIDAHLSLETTLASWLGAHGAILYSDGASAATSTVAAFAKRGDLLVVDEGVHEALLTGVALSRANVRYFRHNDVRDLRRVLEKVKQSDITYKRKQNEQRRFLIVEGLYKNWGTLAPLKDIVKLKEEFGYRLILDDSHGVGAIGPNGRGSLEHAGLKPMVHAEIVTFSLEHALGSVGGVTVGNEEVVDHQRLSGAGYCFSASAPPFLACVGVASVQRIQGTVEEKEDGEEKSREDSGNCADLDENDDGGKNDEKEEGANNAADDNDDRNSAPVISTGPPKGELMGRALLDRLASNRRLLYETLTDPSDPDAVKLRDRLVVTSDPVSPLIYLRLSDGATVAASSSSSDAPMSRQEQTALLDNIASRCLDVHGVAIVSTGRHVKKFLQLIPEPCLRLTATAAQDEEDVRAAVKALGESVEAVMG